MTVTMHQAVRLWEVARYSDLKHLVGAGAYGEAIYKIHGCDVQVMNSHRVEWGPVTKWGHTFKERLEYEWVEISHPEFYIEIQAPLAALWWYCTHADLRNRSHSYFEYRYDLDWVGDVSYLADVITYLDLIQE